MIESDSVSEEYEVQKILKKNVVNDDDNQPHIYYLVHWKGYTEQQATWQPAEYLQNALQKVHEYQRKVWLSKLQYQTKSNPSISNQIYRQENKINKGQNINKNFKEQNQTQQKKKRLYKLNQTNKKIKYSYTNNNLSQSQFMKLKTEMNSQFEIIGAKKCQILFYVKFPNGTIHSIESSKLQKINPDKIIDFYEKNIKLCPSPSQSNKPQIMEPMQDQYYGYYDINE